MTKKIESIGWPVFFAVCSVATFVLLVVPAAFGFQNFNQWGGMYDEHWCNVNVYSGNPSLSSVQQRHELISAGYTGTSRVFSGPMHNEKSCLMWARSRCNTKATDGWTIVWAEPILKKHAFTQGQNVCDLSLPDPSPWFVHEPS